MKSCSIALNHIALPKITGEFSMIPFDLTTLKGLCPSFAQIASELLKHVPYQKGTAFFTLHGKQLHKGSTLRRGGPHTDGNYDRSILSWGGGGGWKVGENGPPVDHPDHARLYETQKGGIVLASNFESCLGWCGDFEGSPGVGGDCSGIKLNNPFMLKRNQVYYGNNHFIHESLPVSANVHRVFARVTLPVDHIYQIG